METKKCSKCNLLKSTTDFSKNPYRKNGNGLRSECKDCRKIMTKLYRDKNKETLHQKDKIYRENRKINGLKEIPILSETHFIDYNKNKHKKRYAEDIMYKCKFDIRNIIKISLKKGNYTKTSKTYQILGCSFDDFKIYIENQFEEWMTWKNHGTYTGNYNETWQYDHIIPLSVGKTEEEVIKLNHHTNFRPLCSKLNNEKSNKL